MGPKTILEAIGASETIAEPKVETLVQITRDGFGIEKLALKAENAFQLPALLYTPTKPNGHAVLHLHGESLKADAAAIEQLVKAGNIVLAAELRGMGETETGLRRKAFGAGRFGRDNLEILTAYLMGKSYVGMRTDDVRTWARFLRTKATALSVIAIGEAAIPALHAAALDRDAFTQITLRRMITTYESLVGAEETFDQTVNLIHGVLRHYDLPDLVQLVGKERVVIEQPVDGMGRDRVP